jgi:transcriptional regulator GlxA family with amidase domain
MPRDKSDKCNDKSVIRALPQVANVGILLYPGTRLTGVYGLTDLFEAGNYYSATLSGEQCPRVEVSHWKMNSRATELECIFRSHPDNQRPLDCLIIAPTIEIKQQNEEIDKALVWAKTQYSSGVLLCAVCGGVFMLARTGLLDGRPATTHWSYSQTFANTFPKIWVKTDELIIDLGDVITAGGTMAWLDLGLRLVDRYLGPVAMVKSAQYYLADPAGRQQRFYANFSPSLHHGDDDVLRVQLWLQSSPPQSITIDRMAVEAKLGRRTFLRRFQKATSLTPTEYAQRLKVQKARELLEFTTLSLKEISWKVGYQDVGYFRKTFQKAVGLSPADYRRRFRPSDPGSAAHLPQTTWSGASEEDHQGLGQELQNPS